MVCTAHNLFEAENLSHTCNWIQIFRKSEKDATKNRLLIKFWTSTYFTLKLTHKYAEIKALLNKQTIFSYEIRGRHHIIHGFCPRFQTRIFNTLTVDGKKSLCHKIIIFNIMHHVVLLQNYFIISKLMIEAYTSRRKSFNHIGTGNISSAVCLIIETNVSWGFQKRAVTY